MMQRFLFDLLRVLILIRVVNIDHDQGIMYPRGLHRISGVLIGVTRANSTMRHGILTAEDIKSQLDDQEAHDGCVATRSYGGYCSSMSRGVRRMLCAIELSFQQSNP